MPRSDYYHSRRFTHVPERNEIHVREYASSFPFDHESWHVLCASCKATLADSDFGGFEDDDDAHAAAELDVHRNGRCVWRRAVWNWETHCAYEAAKAAGEEPF